MDAVARNRERQAEWYGAPLGDLLHGLLMRLGITQAGLADVLGLSAPMLSQLGSGHRAKIANPAALGRLLAVQALVAEPGFDRLGPDQVRNRLATIRAETPTTARNLRAPAEPAPAGRGAADPVAVVQGLLRAVASAGEIEAAAARLEPDLPDLAEFLRAYGTGRTADARAHYERTVPPS